MYFEQALRPRRCQIELAAAMSGATLRAQLRTLHNKAEENAAELGRARAQVTAAEAAAAAAAAERCGYPL